jgi:hypothetical protein
MISLFIDVKMECGAKTASRGNYYREKCHFFGKAEERYPSRGKAIYVTCAFLLVVFLDPLNRRETEESGGKEE